MYAIRSYYALRSNPYLAKYDIDFLIRNAQNDWYVYLNHQTEGKICLQIPIGMNFSEVISYNFV